jgi:hypothetical protein
MIVENSKDKEMQKIIIIALFLILILVGCEGKVADNAPKNFTDDTVFAYIQDSRTGLVFAVYRADNKRFGYSPVPTDQIDAVKEYVPHYKEPSFLKEWRNRVTR